MVDNIVKYIETCGIVATYRDMWNREWRALCLNFEQAKNETEPSGSYILERSITIMGKMNIVISDETERRFRLAVAHQLGLKKGNISRAIEEAIDLWIRSTKSSASTRSEKAKISWGYGF